jgi:hypothetical protein
MEVLQIIFYLRLAQLQLRVTNLYNKEQQENVKMTLLWNVTPCSLQVSTFRRNPQPPSVGCSSVLKLEAARSSETLVHFYPIKRRHIPDESNIRRHCHENPRFHTYE